MTIGLWKYKLKDVKKLKKQENIWPKNLGLWTFTQGKGIKHEKYEKWVQLKAEILASFGEISHAFHCKSFFWINSYAQKRATRFLFLEYTSEVFEWFQIFKGSWLIWYQRWYLRPSAIDSDSLKPLFFLKKRKIL